MAAESPASVAAEYDPKTDPKRRPANPKDPGWEFGYWEDPADRDKVTCKMCNKRVPGGIRRFKQHLAGGYGDVGVADWSLFVAVGVADWSLFVAVACCLGEEKGWHSSPKKGMYMLLNFVVMASLCYI
ncbi:unnamed protein product [Urochloa humidicola]